MTIRTGILFPVCGLSAIGIDESAVAIPRYPRRTEPVRIMDSTAGRSTAAEIAKPTSRVPAAVAGLHYRCELKTASIYAGESPLLRRMLACCRG